MAIYLPHPEIASLGKIGSCGMQQQTLNTFIEMASWYIHHVRSLPFSPPSSSRKYCEIQLFCFQRGMVIGQIIVEFSGFIEFHGIFDRKNQHFSEKNGSRC